MDEGESAGTSLAELNDRQVRMVSAPLATVTELAIEAVGKQLGSPSAWVDAVRDALSPADVALLALSFGPGAPSFVPDAVLPIPDGFAAGFDDEVERILDERACSLEGELHVTGFAVEPPWSYVAKAPQRWLEAHLAALRRAWVAVEPLWIRAVPLLEREVERVGTALASGSFSHLMDGLSLKGHVEGDHWYSRPGAPPAQLGPGLVVQPMLTGPQARLISGHGTVEYIAYPLPGAGRVGYGTRALPRDTPLGALLGEPRAGILRRLDLPTPAGKLAVDLYFAPSAISHHLNAMERAGLVVRERQGRNVLVRRSGRGTALLQIYEP